MECDFEFINTTPVGGSKLLILQDNLQNFPYVLCGNILASTASNKHDEGRSWLSIPFNGLQGNYTNTDNNFMI